jgi:hypothetical protein
VPAKVCRSSNDPLELVRHGLDRYWLLDRCRKTAGLAIGGGGCAARGWVPDVEFLDVRE